MLGTHPYIYTVNMIKLAAARRLLAVRMNVTPRVLSFLRLLRALNVIRRFVFLSPSRVAVVPSYVHMKPRVRHLKMLLRPGRRVMLSAKSLSVLQSRSGLTLFILETRQGLMTNFEARSAGLGGALIAILYC